MQIDNMDPRTDFVQCVNCFVWQVAIGNIAFGQTHTGGNCFIGVAHAVVIFVALLDIVEDLNGFVYGSRLDDDFLKATLQSTVFFNVLTVFIECGSANCLHFASGKCWLEHIRSV